MNTVKAVVSAFLLLIIFTLPALTATQLVGVLGEKAVERSLIWQVQGDEETFIKLVADQATVSYVKAGSHPIFKVTNPNPVGKNFRITTIKLPEGPGVSQTVALTAGDRGKFLLYDRSAEPFNSSYELKIAAGEVVELTLEVTSEEKPSYGTISFQIKEY